MPQNFGAHSSSSRAGVGLWETLKIPPNFETDVSNKITGKLSRVNSTRPNLESNTKHEQITELVTRMIYVDFLFYHISIVLSTTKDTTVVSNFGSQRT